ncbi:MAG: hypothetical protein AAFP76_17020 [Bacteroidota bacterium]
MNTSKKNNDGCLWIFIFGLLSLFGLIFISSITGLNTYLSAALAMLIAAGLTSKWLGRPSIKSLIINIGLIFIIILGLRMFSQFLLSTVTLATEEVTFNKEEGVTLSTIVENNDTVPVFSSHRTWKDNYGNPYEGDLTVRRKDYRSLRKYIDKWEYNPSSEYFWGSLYDHIEQTDTPKLDLVMETFQAIHDEKRLNQMEFAEMVVSCIQDIPYSFVFQEECLDASHYEPSIRSILEECPECCLGNVTYGIQNPVSFLQNLKGDCDTRTVLIYSILKYFNYDVAILNSEFYRHSIIGINLPAAGIFKRHYGKKYVVWETTAKYYEAGKLPGNFNDITHWNVILTSK